MPGRTPGNDGCRFGGIALADQTRRKARGKPPLSRHPLFPAVLALWCGAILALAGLVFAPGLALTGRAALALGLGVIGALLGIALARGIRTPGTVAGDVGEDGAQGPEPTADRLALTYEEPVQPEPAEPTPPAIDREPQVLAVAEFGIEGWNDTPVEAADDEPESDEPSIASAADRLARADLNDLSPVELLERLALSMQRRRRALGEVPAAIASPPEEESGAAMVVLAREDRECGLHEDGYSSLLDMGRLPRARSLDSEAGLAAPDAAAGETEEALRVALSTLRKMSGAA